MDIPTREQLIPGYGMLEEPGVVARFLGKTREEAHRMFAELPATAEDFTYMAPYGFEFYFEPAARYLRESSDGEFASGMLVSMANQMRDGQLPSHVRNEVGTLAAYLKGHAEQFELDLTDPLYARLLSDIIEA